MEEIKSEKIARVLGIYTRLINGYLVNKAEEAVNYNVNERTIQRDIDDIRAFLKDDVQNKDGYNDIIYDRKDRGYRLEHIYKMRMTNAEVLAVCKILLDSRALLKDEIKSVMHKLIVCAVPEKNQKEIYDLIENESFHYVELQHKNSVIDLMWQIGRAIRESRYIEIDYLRMRDKAVMKRRIKPAAIMFSEYYFYLTGFIEYDIPPEKFTGYKSFSPTIYRIDRIKNIKVLDEHFYQPYANRFEEGEFRKRIQFMFGGRLEKVKFRYFGNDIDSILDRLPTARIISEDEGVYTLTAEVFGQGLNMWLRSQGDLVERID